MIDDYFVRVQALQMEKALAIAGYGESVPFLDDQGIQYPPMVRLQARGAYRQNSGSAKTMLFPKQQYLVVGLQSRDEQRGNATPKPTADYDEPAGGGCCNMHHSAVHPGYRPFSNLGVSG